MNLINFLKSSGEHKEAQIANYAENLNKYQKLSNYIGYRHKVGLPVRGQRTHSNAKTCRSWAFHSKVLLLANKLEDDNKAN